MQSLDVLMWAIQFFDENLKVSLLSLSTYLQINCSASAGLQGAERARVACAGRVHKAVARAKHAGCIR